MIRWLSLLLAGLGAACAVAVTPAACGPSEPKLAEREVDRLELRRELQVMGRAVEVEVAITATEISQGLMWRRQLPEDQGMLFVFTSSSERSFYMRNVPISIDICFLDEDGVVINVAAEAEPMQAEPKLKSAAPARFVLELASGWAARHGLVPGERIEIPEDLVALGQLP